jgi:phage baseplate assembly protein gpV
MLLAAIAVAFNASVMNYAENEQMYQTINNGRQALTRMTSELRTAYTVDPGAPTNQCNFFTADGADTRYQFAGNQIRLQKNGGTWHVLCDNVTAATFTKTPTDDGMDSKSVQISLTVRSGDFERTLSAAAVMRRNLPF